ncbi:ABC transporter ATP-binding protein [Anaerocaecibacter muris]|uniref:ABC transporter ATP-binding protein n=1 Tax=Anaerocaecibacter muris TaxID=2941513 RepID=UPI00203FE57B|nr:ABC transporter ATP-binding protein [Anaerocaecibacter muris]
MPPMMKKHDKGAKRDKADFKSFGKLLAYCKGYLPAIISAILLAVGGAVCTIIGPDRISDLTNTIKDGLMLGIDMRAVLDICVGLVIIYGVGAILSYGQQFIMATVTQRATKRLRSDINGKINKLPLNYFDTTTTGDILSRMTNDIDTISQTLSQSTANLVSAIALFIGAVVMMFKTNAVLALTTIGASLLGFVFMAIILKISQKHFDKKQEQLGELDGQIEEVFTQHTTVKAYNAKHSVRRKFAKVNGALAISDWKSQFLSGMMQPIMMFVGNLSYLLIFVVGISMIINGSKAVDIGTLMAFVIYARLFSQPLGTMAQAMTSIQQASAASRRVFGMLESEEMSDESKKTAHIDNPRGDVTFDSIRFGYLPDKEIIHGFSAELKKGQKVAIVGPTGAGKTTIVNLLMRFYELNAGDIRIDGTSIKDMKRERVHDLFDMILQNTWLFEGTIRENLVYNKQGVTDERLNEVCAAVGLSHYIACLPDGYDTVISESSQISEGQKQQLTIARAMIKDSPLLILDEATSNVDTRTELAIQNAMDKLTEGRTSFVIAHRLSTIKNADVIMVLKDGDIIEQGNHEQLLQKKGFYAELYNAQFAGATD